MAKISMKYWLAGNERTRVLPTDKWYLDFSTDTLPLVKASPLFKYEDTQTQIEAALALGMYFQDAIAQNGGWKSFTEAYQALYGHYIPFYALSEHYVPDEINQEDVTFVLWSQKSRFAIPDHPYTLCSPYDEALLELSQSVYKMMDIRFEEAPISEGCTPSYWVMGPDLLEMPMSGLPEVTPTTQLSKDAERCLKYSQGKPLLYFADYKELRTFLTDVLQWPNEPSALLPELKDEEEFVVYANAKGMLVAPNVAAYFCEAHNPMYDADRAAMTGYEMFCLPGYCPFDLLKYGMTKGILPDLELPFLRGKETLHRYWDFIARYYLCEYYEGE